MALSRSRRLLLALLVALAATLAAAPALAAKRGKGKTKKSAEEVRAAALYKEAKAAYDLGKFDEALPLLEEAYELFPSPAIQFNLAQVHRQLGNWDSARYLYLRYVDSLKERLAAGDGDSAALEEKIAAVNTTIAEVEATIKKEEEARKAALMPTSAPASAPVAPPKKPLDPKIFYIGGAALGGAAVVATIIVLAIVQPGYVRLRETSLGDQRFEF